MIRLWKYAYISPKIHGIMSFMLTEDDFNALVKKSLDEIYSFLEHTPYREVISAVPLERFESIAFERLLVEHFLKTYEYIKEDSPKDVRMLLDVMLKKFEVENLKTILRAKIAGLSVEETMSYIVPVGELDEEFCKSLLERSESVKDVVKLLVKTDYGPILEKGLEDFEETGLPISLETALDQYIFGLLWKGAGEINRADREIAKRVVGTEIDVINMKLILRSKTLDIKADQTRKLILSIFFQLTEESVKRGIEAEDVEDAVKALMVKPYRNLLSTVLAEYEASKSLSAVEQVFDKFLLKNIRDILKYPSPFHVGVVLGFLNVKWAEVKNLRAIIKGKEDNMPEEVIKKKLLI